MFCLSLIRPIYLDLNIEVVDATFPLYTKQERIKFLEQLDLSLSLALVLLSVPDVSHQGRLFSVGASWYSFPVAFILDAAGVPRNEGERLGLLDVTLVPRERGTRRCVPSPHLRGTLRTAALNLFRSCHFLVPVTLI